MISPRFASHTLGSGPIVIDLWLDYICPFSRKQFNTIYHTVAPEAERKFPKTFTFVFQHVPQPWHGQSTYAHEAGIAAGLIEPKRFWEFSDKLFEKSEDFYDVGSYNKTHKELVGELAEIAAETGINKDEFIRLISVDTNGKFKNPGSAVTNDLKYFVKVGRQNSVHVTPTVYVNGLNDPEISSSWDLNQWLEKLDVTRAAVSQKL